MRRVLLALCLSCLSATALAQQETAALPGARPAVELRDKVLTEGAALRLGDVFRIEGPAAAREIAPAPPPGETGVYSTAFLAAAARAAGFSWQPQPGFTQISIEGPRRGEQQRPPSHFAQATRGPGPAPAATTPVTAAPAGAPASLPVIKRGEHITLTYVQGPLRVSTRARALNAAAAGETVRVLTLPAERQLEARVTGPGEAMVSQ